MGDHDAYNHDNIRLTIVDVTQINRNNRALVQIGRGSEFSIPVQILANVTVVGASSCNWMYPTLDSDRGISQLDVYMGRHATYIHPFAGGVR